MKIFSQNVNGVRARIKGGLENAIKEVDPDIICLQEFRARPDQVPKSFLDEYIGYYSIHQKPGYAGAATFVRASLDQPFLAVDDFPDGDEPGRVSILDFKGFKLINSYSPNSGQNLEKLERRTEWQAKLCAYIKEQMKPVILCGDLNVAPLKIDTNTKSRAGTSFAERKAFQDILDLGYADVFRERNPQLTQYTWFSNQYNAREQNKGMRLDQFVIANELMPLVNDMYHCYEDKLVAGSDHVPIILDINL